MQNPFLRLKHYRTDPTGNDPKENHATEVLAACLVLSSATRAEFLSFLFDGERTFTTEEADNWRVETQVPTDDGDWVDLLLEEPGACSVVVEIKVAAPEDGQQVKRYVAWLEREKDAVSRHVFWLVRTQNHVLHIEDFGGKRRLTWHGLYVRLASFSKTGISPTDLALLQNLCGYLEAETIVSTWKPNDLLGFSVGLKARSALEKLFAQIEERLRELDEDYEAKIAWTDDPWTRLEVGRKSWASVFGPAGYLNKVWMFFPTEGMEHSSEDQFHFELVLWARWHRCDWSVARSKLHKWAEKLAANKFNAWIVGKRGREIQADVLTYDPDEPPVEIKACHESPTVSGLMAEEIRTLSNAALVDRLVQRVIAHCDVISGLV